MHDKFSPVPNGVVYFDGFYDSSVNTNFWVATVAGATTITEASGKVTMVHDAGGAAGSGLLATLKRFGWQNTLSVGIALETGSLAADGNHAEASLVLYKDSTHYIRFGAYRDTAGGVNQLKYLRYKMAAGAETVVSIGTEITDATPHRYSIVILGDHAVLMLDENVVHDIETADFVDYYAWLESTASAVGDHIHAAFSRFLCAKSIDFLSGVVLPADVKHPFAGSVTLGGVNASEITFDAATHGRQFELTLAAALVRGTVAKAVQNDGGAYTDYTSQCNDMGTRDVVLLPAVPVAGDAFIVMAAEKFCYVDVYMEGGIFNTDNVIAIKYWNGGAWAAIPGVSDGTFSTQSLGQSGRVSFAPPVDWAAVAINGYTGYPVSFEVTTAGTVQPLATHIQVSLDSSTGFDQVAQEFTDLTIYLKSNFPTLGYQTNPGDSLVYTQAIGHRDVSINGFRCNGDTKLGFQLSAVPDKNVVIPYFGFTRRI
jgi:hypothetical protein